MPAAVPLPWLKGRKSVSAPAKAGGHIDFIDIDGEMNQRALLEGENPFARVAIRAVLVFGVLDGLGSELVLQFGRGDRDAVDA